MKKDDLCSISLKLGTIFLVIFLLCIIFSKLHQDSFSVFSTDHQRKLPIYCVECSEPKVSLTFDAAWGNEDTNDILSILKKYNVHATFFMTGGWIDTYPEDVKNIAKGGHDLGNHSDHHKQMSTLSSSECLTEIQSVNSKIYKLTQQEPILFRPPYGDYNNTLVDATQTAKCFCIQWDVDSLDWKNYGVDSIVSTILNHKHLGNGSIILMHNGAKYTKDALPTVIEGLQTKGYRIVPVSQLIYTTNFQIDIEGRQHHSEPQTSPLSTPNTR